MASPEKNITETGPQDYRQIQTYLNRFLTRRDREGWAQKNAEALQGMNLAFNSEGVFDDPETERTFLDTKFNSWFKNDSKLDSYWKLSPEDRDRMYVKARQEDFAHNLLLDRVGKNEYGFPVKYKDEPTKQEPKQATPDNPPTIDTGNIMPMTPGQIRALSEANSGTGLSNPNSAESKYEEERALAIKNRYLGEDGEVRRQDDINALKEYAPQLSNFYAEFVDGNNPYIKSDDIDWGSIAPELMTDIENGDYTRASASFNRLMQGIMSENQGFWEKFGHWNGRFLANIGLMAVDLAGLVEGAGEALVGDIIIPAVSGDGVDWAQAGATVLYDNYLANLSYDWQQDLRENLPVYTSSGDPLLDPESSAFMASMVIPGGAISKIGTGAKLAGKSGKALARAERFNKLTGYTRDFERAGRELDNVLSDARNINNRRLIELGQETQYKALREGKSLAQAQQEARTIQQQALTDVYRRGTIQRNQIRLSSILEGQVEAIGADRASQENFQQAWDQQVRALTTQALTGELDLSEQPYNLADAERYEQQLLNEGYLEEIVKHMKNNPESANYSEYELQFTAMEYLRKESQVRAQIDNYIDTHKEEFQKLADSQSNKAGMITMLENYALLRLTEGFGGWTTRIPTYKNIAPVAREQRTFMGRAKDFLGGATSFGSNTSQLMSRIKFDDMGRAVRRVTPKSVAQTVGKVGGTVAIEVGQEVGQELFTSGAEGTSAHNAETFVLSHLAGPGREFVDDSYENQLFSLFQHAGYGRTTEDFMKIIKATSLQMLTGVPSVMKYKNRYSRVKDADGKTHLYDNMRRGSHESALSYVWRNIESWMPMNSPVAQSITQVANTNTDVNTFIRVHNALLDDSRAYSGYASSSMNYAARAFDAASREDESDYEHNKFAAQTAEAIFLAQLRGKNQKSKMAYYQNLADINTKRDGESEEGFRARQRNTLQQLREEAAYNSIKNANDVDLLEWAETNGKTMLEMVEKMANKSQQLYEQYDGNITWEQLYGTLYSDALVDYTNGRINGIEDIFKRALPIITDTDITDEEGTDENGKPVRLYTESEILRMNPVERQQLIERAEGNQKAIANNLIAQLEAFNTRENLGRNIRTMLQTSAKEAKIVQEASNDLTRLTRNPREFLNSIQQRKSRIAANKVFKSLNKILTDDTIDEDTKRSRLSDELSNMSNIADPQAYLALLEALNTLSTSDSNLINDVLTADRTNGRLLNNLINDLQNKTSDEELQENYQKLLEKIQTSHISFLSSRLRDILNESEKTLLDRILERYQEAQQATPVVEIEEGATENTEEPEGESRKPAEVSEEEFNQNTVKSIKAHLKLELDKLVTTLNITNTEEIENTLNNILSGEFEDLNDIVLAITKAIQNEKNETNKTLLTELVKTLKDYSPDRVDNTRNLATNKLSLADPTMFLNWSESQDGNYAMFYKKYRIPELLRSGQIKIGTPIYVMWDSEFVADTKRMYKQSTGNEATQNQIGLVAVVEGSFDGYPTITIGDKTYTRIGLFRAYGKGEHNSRDVVANMISSITGSPFDEQGTIPDIEDAIIIDKKNNPISFTISALNESALIPTPEQQNSARVLSEERQHVIDNESNEPDEAGSQERAKKWFVDNLIVVTNKRGNKLPALRIDRHNTQGYSTIPIQVKSISDTAWMDTTVGQALRDGNIGLVSTVNGIPVFNRVAETLKDFMTNPTVQPAIKSFLKEIEKLNKKRISEAKYKKQYEELLTKLNKDCNALLNSRKGNSLFNRLSIPKDMEYYIDYITEVEEGTENVHQYFTLGVKLANSSHEAAGNIEFMRYEAPQADGTTEVITDDRVVNALRNLILDENGEVRKSYTGTDEFVKWQLNYSDIENRAGIAEELLSDLYDMDVFLIETDNLISSQMAIDILPNDASITESKPQPIRTEGNPDIDNKAGEIRTDNTNDAITRVDLLQLHETADTNYTENMTPVAQQFKWGREGVKLGDIPIRFIGLTEGNDLTIIVEDDMATPENKAAITEELKKLGVPNASSFNLSKASSYSLPAATAKEGEVIKRTEQADNVDDISMADELAAARRRVQEQQPELTEEELESKAQNNIKNNIFEHWMEDLYDAEIWDGNDSTMDELIDNLKAKYGSYRKAYEVLRSVNNTDEMLSLFRCS